MTYTKPEVQLLGDATDVIQDNRKRLQLTELGKPAGTKMLEAAYDPDEQ